MAKNHVHVLRSSSSATSLSCGHKHEESKGGQTGPLMVTSSGNSNPGSSTPRTHGRTRFASFSNVLSRNFLRNDGSCDNMEDTVSNSPRRERVAKVENCAAARSSLFRTASSSMRSVFSSFKILGTGSRRVPVSKLQDDANPGQRYFPNPPWFIGRSDCKPTQLGRALSPGPGDLHHIFSSLDPIFSFA